MSFQLDRFEQEGLSQDYLGYLVEQEAIEACQHYARFWDYFRNTITPAVGRACDSLNANSRPYFQAQEQGLPARITGVDRWGGGRAADLARKEVVVENDIAWRIQAMVDFLFGKPPTIRSLAGDRQTAQAVEALTARLFEANGGSGFFQELALLGAIYGFVDIVLRPPAEWMAIASRLAARLPAPAQAASRGPESSGAPRPATPSAQDAAMDPAAPRSKTSASAATQLAGLITLETVEASRILPVLDEDDFRSVRCWLQCYRKALPALEGGGPLSIFGIGNSRLEPRTAEVVEIISPRWWQRYEDRRLAAEGPNLLGRLPVVHIQNLPLPGHYEGLGDVEPLLPLQDELNTRLSDRASRVTYQSFKMYLAKGIDDFLERPVGPGQMWSTHNNEASIQEFGHDAGSPSEDVHIQQVREAMDKVSGVTGLAAGLIRGNVGNLTSATALRVLLSGLLSRTERKQVTYGQGIARIIELMLELMDRSGLLITAPEDRRIEIHWPSPLPEDQHQRLADAQVKAALGVPAKRVLAELGYDEQTLAQ